ncbi:CPBP family intramembrane glutamic endopeptidase [Verrucomicrobiota bacterium]
MKPSSASAWSALVAAMTVPFIAALFYFVLCEDAVLARIVYVGAKVFLVFWPLVCTLTVFRSRHPRPKIRWTRIAGALAPGLLSGIAISAVILGLMLSPLGRLVESSAHSIRDRVEHLGVMDCYWVFAVFLSLIHSLIEEYYWRWFVYGKLRGLIGRKPAAALSSAAFASHHVIITGQLMNWPLGVLCGVGVAMGGILWAYLYERHRVLVSPWLSHAVVDFAVMAIGYHVLMIT